MALIIILAVLFLILDYVLYSLVPYDYMTKFSTFWRRAILGSGIFIKQESNWQGFKVIIVDSCEYINRYEGGHTGYRFTHKGNCKFCAERSKK